MQNSTYSESRFHIASYEEQLLHAKSLIMHGLKSNDLSQNNGYTPKLCAWDMVTGKDKTYHSMISNDEESLNQSNTATLNLLAGNITSKYFQIYMSQQLLIKNLRLKETVAEIKLTNNNPQSIISNRREELQYKNKKQPKLKDSALELNLIFKQFVSHSQQMGSNC